ncbi:MAG: 30S ribosomal protein THX [Alphaproteobacteria bacterium]|nr:30S ribosomal protein THX [Alphaproteobacteria bacterium]
MGKGDKKTRRGKIVIGTSGVRRARKKKKTFRKTAASHEPLNTASIVEKPVEIVKEPIKKSPKKSAETTPPAPEKPKVARSRKKPAESSETPENPVEG